jgi:hypothetical protein
MQPIFMQTNYLLQAVAYIRGIRTSCDATRYAETVTRKQFEESNGTSKRELKPERSNGR